MIVGAAHRDRAQHGVDRAGPVGDELGVMARAAVDSRAAVAGVGGQQLLQQRTTQPRHRGADRQLHRLQALAERAQRGNGQFGQAFYLGGELRFDLLAEPPFSASVPAEGATAVSASGGRASQMASLTSTIRSDSPAKRW